MSATAPLGLASQRALSGWEAPSVPGGVGHRDLILSSPCIDDTGIARDESPFGVCNR